MISQAFLKLLELDQATPSTKAVLEEIRSMEARITALENAGLPEGVRVSQPEGEEA